MKTTRSQFRADAANPWATAILGRDKADRDAALQHRTDMERERARFWRSIKVMGCILAGIALLVALTPL